MSFTTILLRKIYAVSILVYKENADSSTQRASIVWKSRCLVVNLVVSVHRHREMFTGVKPMMLIVSYKIGSLSWQSFENIVLLQGLPSLHLKHFMLKLGVIQRINLYFPIPADRVSQIGIAPELSPLNQCGDNSHISFVWWVSNFTSHFKLSSLSESAVSYSIHLQNGQIFG